VLRKVLKAGWIVTFTPHYGGISVEARRHHDEPVLTARGVTPRKALKYAFAKIR